MEKIVIFDGDVRDDYLAEQILLLVTTLEDLNYTPDEIIEAFWKRIAVLKSYGKRTS